MLQLTMPGTDRAIIGVRLLLQPKLIVVHERHRVRFSGFNMLALFNECGCRFALDQRQHALAIIVATSQVLHISFLSPWLINDS